MKYDITIKYTPEFLRGMAIEELTGFLKQVQQRYFELRTQSSAGGREKYTLNPDLFGKVKKDIARIRTILRERK